MVEIKGVVVSIEAIERFFLSTWIWGMTWGISHIPINIIVMLVLFKFIGRLKIVTAILLAFFSQVFATALYSMFILFLVFVVKLKFIPIDTPSSFQNINFFTCVYFFGAYLFGFTSYLFFNS